MRSLSEQSAITVVEGGDDTVDKEKKKNRRRSKRNPPNPANGKAGDSCQGKNKLNMDCKRVDFGNSLVPRKGFYYEYSSCAGEDVHDELNGPVDYNYFFWVDPG
ncbi:hypothetical protein NC653_008580 [Populus alba x Populus x berolinensis]|uniref:Uncharacterized protein n=1 Tax=Populus alba x Populus x berolinensis TaxID=444605 RepID=A0AAD6R758_9ROSI|nr:hypothetical protein NC653_008580 [Populus alba x Populus x berolinensis]